MFFWVEFSHYFHFCLLIWHGNGTCSFIAEVFIKHGDFHYQLRARKCNSLPTSSELFGQHAERPFGTFRCNRAGSGGNNLVAVENPEKCRKCADAPPLSYLIFFLVHLGN